MLNKKHFEVAHRKDNKTKIFYRTVKGKINAEEIISSLEEEIQSGLVNLNLKGVITDYTSAEVVINVEDLDKFTAFFERNSELMTKVKYAVVIDSPVVAMPVLFKKRNPLYKMSTYNTIEAAELWINKY